MFSLFTLFNFINFSIRILGNDDVNAIGTKIVGGGDGTLKNSIYLDTREWEESIDTKVVAIQYVVLLCKITLRQYRQVGKRHFRLVRLY